MARDLGRKFFGSLSSCSSHERPQIPRLLLLWHRTARELNAPISSENRGATRTFWIHLDTRWYVVPLVWTAWPFCTCTCGGLNPLQQNRYAVGTPHSRSSTLAPRHSWKPRKNKYKRDSLKLLHIFARWSNEFLGAADIRNITTLGMFLSKIMLISFWVTFVFTDVTLVRTEKQTEV